MGKYKHRPVKSWEMPQWMIDCLEAHQKEGRLPTTADFMAWREGMASCALEHAEPTQTGTTTTSIE